VRRGSRSSRYSECCSWVSRPPRGGEAVQKEALFADVTEFSQGKFEDDATLIVVGV